MLTPAIKAMDQASRLALAKMARAQGLDELATEIEQYDPTKIQVTASVLVADIKQTVTRRVTVTEQIEARDWTETHPAPPDHEPMHRTLANPGHLQWKSMDQRACYRVGAPWHSCPNCTTYSRIQRYRVRKPYRAATGDELTVDEVKSLMPNEVEWMDDWKEREEPPTEMANGDLKPVTGMNLYRFYSDGHEECTDCGWKGPSAEAKRAAKAQARGNKPVPVHIDKKWLMEQLLKRNKNGG